MRRKWWKVSAPRADGVKENQQRQVAWHLAWKETNENEIKRRPSLLTSRLTHSSILNVASWPQNCSANPMRPAGQISESCLVTTKTPKIDLALNFSCGDKLRLYLNRRECRFFSALVQRWCLSPPGTNWERGRGKEIYIMGVLCGYHTMWVSHALHPTKPSPPLPPPSRLSLSVPPQLNCIYSPIVKCTIHSRH